MKGNIIIGTFKTPKAIKTQKEIPDLKEIILI